MSRPHLAKDIERPWADVQTGTRPCASRSPSRSPLLRGAILLRGFAATKTLHIAFTAAESTFDPAASDDIPSSDIIRMVFDPPLDYDYHARPSH